MSQPSDHGYTPAEERANTITAALGLLAAFAYLPFLFTAAQKSHYPLALPGAIAYAAALLLLYGASTLYHALPSGEWKRRIRVLDHCAIFTLIAGTYTPLIVGPLWPHHGPLLLGLEWTLALVGITLKIFGRMRLHRVTDLIYVGMGWLGLFWLRAFAEATSWTALSWILGGGVVYTVGIIFYKAKGRPHTHLVWHLFVFAGTASHAYAIWKYVF